MKYNKRKLSFEELPEVNSERWLSLEDLPGEEWRDVVGYEGFYKVSDYGRVKSLNRVIMRKNGNRQTWRGKIIKIKFHKNGYAFFQASSPSQRIDILVHRAVAKAFIDNPNGFPIINHKDENRQNNCVYNIEWCTSAYNNNYGNHYEKFIASMTKNGYIRKVYQYSLDGCLVATYNSLKEATEKTGITNISAVCFGKHSMAGGYYWSRSETPPKFVYKKTSSRIVCYLDDNGKILCEYPSLRKAAEAHNTNHRVIANWCRGTNPNWIIKYE